MSMVTQQGECTLMTLNCIKNVVFYDNGKFSIINTLSQ